MDSWISGSADCRAALYIRLSREDGCERESESVTNQRGLLADFAERHGLRVAGIYVDDGWSGTTFDRPGFQRMIGDIEAGTVNLVITKDLSRLGRDYIQTGYYLERFFPEKGVRYISLLDGVDTGTDSSANDITPFKAILNDMYAKDISKKITSVKRDKQKKGLFIGGKAPYGYKLSESRKNFLMVDEEAAAVVRRMFGLAREGVSCREIAARLNAERIPPPARYAGLNAPGSGLWSAERVTFILKNETYIGNLVQGRSRKISYKLKRSRKLPPEEWIVVENTHEPLVGREAFEKVQMLIESRRHTRSRTHDHPLKGLIHCAECGHPLGVVPRTLSGGRLALYFVCRTSQRASGACTGHCARVDAVTDAVADKVREVCRQCLDRESVEEIIGSVAEEIKADHDRERQTVRTSARIEDLTARLDQVYADRLSGLLDEGDFQRVYQGLKEERSKLRERANALEALCAEEALPGVAAEDWIRMFLDGADRSRELLVSLIERVELTEAREIRIFFRFREPLP